MIISIFGILLTVFGTCFSNPSCPEIKPDMLNVHLVCHTHDDVGWLKTVDEYYYGSQKYITTVGVQYILDSVVPFLLKDPNKKFIYVESAFFFRWWDEQGDRMKNNVKKLVENGQLEFINGGWCMNDEASTHYNSIIDQMTVGLVRLNDTFGPVAFPRIGWQIDPFGHSNEQASLFAQMGMDGELFARVDYRDKTNRWDSRKMEMIWKSSHSLGEDSWIFTGVLPHHYEPPSGFCFDNQCGDDPIMDDPNLEDYNKDDKVRSFIEAANYEVTGFISNQNIIMTMGSDFHYVNANSWYKNLDKLIKYVNELQSNGSNINLVVKQFASLTGSPADESIKTLAEAMGVLQHHDAVAGTSKQHVADDYSLMLSKGVDNARGLLSKGFSYFTGNDESTEFTYCPLLNISSCSYLEGKTSFVVNVYNSIGRPKSFYVRVPVEESTTYTVQDQQGNYLDSQVVPLPDQIVNLPGRTSTANFDLVFYAQDIPALGALQYLVEVAAEESTNKRNSILSNIKEIIDGKDTVVENKVPESWATINVTQDWKWYEGWNGGNYDPSDRASGAYIFRPTGRSQEITDQVNATVIEGPLVEEIHQEWSSWVTQVLRTYQDKNYVEIEWLVGPIPVDDDVGKEIINHFNFEEFITNKTFYTDSNGRELQKRIKDYRETYDLPLNAEPVSRNYYPVTAQFVINSVNGQGSAAVLNDRAQGGTSLGDGQIELMVHRRLLHDDAFGVGEALNEQAYGKSGLSAPLPENIHLLTLEPWSSSGTWLLRLENFYEVNESSLSESVDVDLESLFSEWTVSNIRELVLGANAYKEDVVRLRWNSQSEEIKPVAQEEQKVKSSEAVYSFSPMQIRTFLIDVTQK
ncbi:hypothetical protein Anas_06480 [Armadillidium nasatum]|uniref:Alpha-mannosidase n=1 Tax=Armadillidium nasatum TaxID=96803 RepID=A0A5N5SWS5_9CRUS|nr:hypothetical protein Anas_06480 [Armadillidium nasatum]